MSTHKSTPSCSSSELSCSKNPQDELSERIDELLYSLSLFLFPTRPAVEPITVHSVHWALLFGSPVSSECSAVLWNAFTICLHFFTSTNARWVFDFYGMTPHHPLKMAQLAHTTQHCGRNCESAHERHRPLFEAVNTNFCVSHRLYCLFVACFSSPKKLKKHYEFFDVLVFRVSTDILRWYSFMGFCSDFIPIRCDGPPIFRLNGTYW